jgi:hypothetical protein
MKAKASMNNPYRYMMFVFKREKMMVQPLLPLQFPFTVLGTTLFPFPLTFPFTVRAGKLRA